MRRRSPQREAKALGRTSGADAFDTCATSVSALWRGFAEESFAFWMICAYLIVEYVRPQSIIPALDFLPWGKLVLILSMFGLLLERPRKLTSDPTNWLMTLFLAVLLTSSWFAEYPDVSWEHWFDFFGWYVIYFLVINIVTTERRFVIFLALFLLASFKLSFFGARTWAMRGFSFTSWGIMGPSGPFQNSGELSVQMLMSAPIAFEYFLYIRPRAHKAFIWGMLTLPLTAAMTIIGASSRGSQIALAYQGYRILLKGRLTFRSLVITGVAAGLLFAAIPTEQLARFQNVGSDRTSQQRLLYWQRGVEMIHDHPVLGVGYFNFAPYFADHFPDEILFGTAQLPHNIFIQVGTDAGLLGLVVFVALIVRNLSVCRRIRQLASRDNSTNSFPAHVSKGLLIALWGFVIAGQFVTITYYPFLWINLAMSVALLSIVKAARAELPAPISTRRTRI